jgi:dihydroorotate dehydrogenase (NAD+) catalytic subunit
MAFGVDPCAAADVTRAVRQATTLPVIVKLTPNAGNTVGVARAVVEAGADALSLINTLQGMVMDVESRRPVLPRRTGGLSGPAVRPIALALVYDVAGAVEVPVIGLGGIATAHDALEFLLAGATAVQVGTACFVDPLAPLRVLEGIAAHMERAGVEHISELTGAGRAKGPD